MTDLLLPLLDTSERRAAYQSVGQPTPVKVPLGRIHAHAIGFDDTVISIIDRIASGLGGYVVTPNVDHVCTAQRDERLRSAYRDAWLAVPDGMPLLWIARAAGTPLPEKVSGSDLMVPLIRRVTKAGLRIAFCGSTPEVCELAAQRTRALVPGVQICAREHPTYRAGHSSADLRQSLAVLEAASPDLIFVAMSGPHQELFMQSFAAQLAPAVLIGIGGSLDFLAGATRRAPQWMQRSGLEWMFRLVNEPRRLAHRYLVRGWSIGPIAARTIISSRLRAKHARRIRVGPYF